MTLSELRRVLDERGIQLTKSLGQHFLHDANQLRRIVEAAELTASDRVLEIGPGLGALTEWLLARAAEVFAIEKDQRLVAELKRRFAAERAHLDTAPDFSLSPRRRSGERARERILPSQTSRIEPLNRGRDAPPRVQADRQVGPTTFMGRGDSGTQGPSSPQPSPPSEGGEGVRPSRVGAVSSCALAEPRLHLLHEDALRFLRRESHDWSGWKLVSNLPYSVGSPILVELALQEHPPGRIVATLQLEVAQRLMAGAGDDDYGVLSLLVQLRYEPRGLFKVPASCFFPEPDVASACVTLVRRQSEWLPADLRVLFARVVKLAFSQRRKMMLKLLKQQWPADKLEAAFAALGILPQARAETLGLDQFVELTRRLKA